jgi:hypothetical protein
VKQVLFFIVFILLGVMTLAQQPSSTLLGRIDHLVYATPDLQLGIDAIEKQLGVKATAGGQHPGLGTRNALVALGPTSYLEIIGPDPEQPKPSGPRRFGIDDLKTPRIVRWVVKSSELPAVAEKAAKSGSRLGRLLQAAGGVLMASCSPGATPIRRSSSPMVWCRFSSTGDHRRILR